MRITLASRRRVKNKASINMEGLGPKQEAMRAGDWVEVLNSFQVKNYDTANKVQNLSEYFLWQIFFLYYLVRQSLASPANVVPLKKSRRVKWQETLEKINIHPNFLKGGRWNRLSAFRETTLNHGFYGPKEAWEWFRGEKKEARRETGDGKKTMEPLFLYWQLWRQKTIQTILTKKRTRFQNARRYYIKSQWCSLFFIISIYCIF